MCCRCTQEKAATAPSSTQQHQTIQNLSSSYKRNNTGKPEGTIYRWHYSSICEETNMLFSTVYLSGKQHVTSVLPMSVSNIT